MTKRRRCAAGAFAFVVTAALYLGTAPLEAQAPRRLPPLENIKVLAGWDGGQVRDEMRRMSEAIGVKCDHCHVQGNFASDEKRAKHTGRRMLELTMSLNRQYFATHTPADGESRLGRITCYTCHQGVAIPKGSAGLAMLR
jgi:photosynthetic reaction center cytochrome c subunit